MARHSSTPVKQNIVAVYEKSKLLGMKPKLHTMLNPVILSGAGAYATAQSKLSRFAGVQARRRNPERSRGNYPVPRECPSSPCRFREFFRETAPKTASLFPNVQTSRRISLLHPHGRLILLIRAFEIFDLVIVKVPDARSYFVDQIMIVGDEEDRSLVTLQRDIQRVD